MESQSNNPVSIKYIFALNPNIIQQLKEYYSIKDIEDFIQDIFVEENDVDLLINMTIESDLDDIEPANRHLFHRLFLDISIPMKKYIYEDERIKKFYKLMNITIVGLHTLIATFQFYD